MDNIIDRYNKRICDMYLKTHPGVNPETTMSLINQMTMDRLINIPCNMENSGRHELFQTTIIDVMDWIETRKPIITGNGAFFKQHEEYLSPSIPMLEALGENRAKKKKIMYSFDKKSVEYINAFTSQNSIKTISNADYGGSGTVFSPFFSIYIPSATTQTAKNVTTTLICCLEFVTLSSTGEDDKWAKCNNINELFDMINCVLDTEDPERIYINDTYSVKEVLQWLVTRSNNISLNDIRVLESYLETLSTQELSKLMLAFNVRLVLTRYLSNEVESVMSYFKSHPMNYENITKETLYESGFGEKKPVEISDTMDHIIKVVLDNCIYPFMLNDVEVRSHNMKRKIVCVTDTDSLMVHFASWLDEFQARSKIFRDRCIFAAAFGMRLFVEGIIPRFVSYIASGCRIEDMYYQNKFIFKNEFVTLAMTLYAKKMYTSSTFGQEGEPRDIHDIAVTGLSFKKRDAAEFLEPIMLRLYDKYILTATEISVEGILDELYALKSELEVNIKTDTSYYKLSSLKDIGAYNPKQVLPQQMRGAIVWNNIMPDEEMLPMDRVRIIPLSFKLLQEYSHIGNVSEMLRLNLIDNEKMKVEPMICLPEHYKEIPEWIQPVIDIDYTIDSLLSPFKQMLGLFDVTIHDTRGGMMPSRMIYL